MCMERCTKCSSLLDTDANPEVYREDQGDQPYCDRCHEQVIEAQDAENNKEGL